MHEEERTRRFPEYEALERSADNRSPYQRDRDRVLYSGSLRRLTGVTQVASATEGPFFHNRLTHTLEVAQVARRLAELLRGDTQVTRHKKPSLEQLEALGGLDPDVVETAALAHDLGHPPYGHIGEDELNTRVSQITKSEGFEGNAQSFRIVTRLALRHHFFDGLNLTRASLNAILKYPWLWADRPPGKSNKWGSYISERPFFEFARAQSAAVGVPGLEASIMDWADDITYAVHDVEDFYRVNLIPLDVLIQPSSRGQNERDRFLNGIFARYSKRERTFPYTAEETRLAADALFQSLRVYDLDTPYDGTPRVRRVLRSLTAWLIARYVIDGASLGISAEKPLSLNTKLEREVKILKELTWHYVIEGPHLATQQHGQRRIIRELFDVYYSAISERRWWLLPIGFRAVVESAYNETADEALEAARLTADLIAGFSEQEAVMLHQRITGVAIGPLLGTLYPR